MTDADKEAGRGEGLEKVEPTGPTDDLPPPHPLREAFFEGWNAGYDCGMGCASYIDPCTAPDPDEAWNDSEAARRLRQSDPGGEPPDCPECDRTMRPGHFYDDPVWYCDEGHPSVWHRPRRAAPTDEAPEADRE